MRSLSQIIILLCLIAVPVLAQSPHGDNFELDCSLCHQSTSWKVDLKKVEFDHSTTSFDLVGQHKFVDCKSCHQTLKFKEIENTDCISCHTDIHKGTVGKDCSRCHTPDSWMVKDINGLHQDGRFPLLGKHRTADCVQCHSGYVDLNFEPLDTDCFSCHASDYNSTTNPNHAQAGFSTDCNECHSVNALDWATIEVDHSFFPLTGGHAIADCFACHTPGGDFSGLSPDCISCHEPDFNNQSNDPNHIQAGFSTDCKECHTIMGWSPAPGFNHNQTQYPLTGKHVTVDCSSCHTSGYSGTPMDCYSCHQSDFENTNDPNHIQAGFATTCDDCHTTAGWDDANFDHSQTQFPLTGRHIGVDCSACHQSGYSNTPMDCYACHQSDYESANDPNHVTLGYPTDCTQCHTTAGWDGANFDHNQTAFPLTGAHTTTQCLDCHANGYQGTPTECYSCHQSDYEGATDPNHVVQGYPHDCTQCHSTTGWDGASFDHSQTNFPLTGAHTTAQCLDCHANGYQGTPTDCYSCHQSDYEGTNDPNHVALGYPHDCSQCHSTSGWDGANFDHNQTNFPLTGAHTTVQCLSCHENGYQGTPTECFACHETDYNNTTDPDHQAQGFPTTCNDCHTTTAWTPANFDHSFYPTGNNHNNVTCNQCHSQPNYDPQCLSCHQNDFNEGHNPGDPTECWDCHNTSQWGNASFNHNNTNFPLTGAHTTVACLDCHANGYAGTPTECFACHETVYNNTTNPDHQALQLSTTCTDCHTTDPGWSPAQFPQHSNYFELLGAHASITNCDDCHNGNYNNPPNTCMGCHSSNYNGTTNPPHQALNFPQDCLQCHNMNGWTPATFDHSFYPTGSHHTNLNCNQCHSQSNYDPQCLSCHQDDFNEGHNPGDPTECWLCHSTSTWGNAVFDHNNTNFPLTGAHVSLNCLDCHANGYGGTPTECFACHESYYNNTTNPDHQALQLSTNCNDCHSTDPGWSPAQFPQHSNYFELLGAHANIANCDDCHNGNYNNTPNTCMGCHSSDYSSTTDPPHQTLNFPQDCLQCHNMNGWTPATFNHSFYPTGSHHTNVNCNQCHSEANYQPQCLSCHYDDFLEGHSPGHSTDCWNCHSTSHWGDAPNPKNIIKRLD